jgi:hypothetical protein
MITRFQATGASAGTAKCSNELSIPTTRPLSASSRTIVSALATAGQSRIRRAAAPLSRPQANSGPSPVKSTSSTPSGVT